MAAARASTMASAQQQIMGRGSSASSTSVAWCGGWSAGWAAGRRPGIEIEVDAPEPLFVPLATAVPLGLIMRELLTNAMTHGFPGGRVGRVVVGLERTRGGLCVTVADDGIGLAPGVSLQTQRSTGLTIVKSLSRQLGAELTMEAQDGTTVRLILPAHPAKG